jgi:hypothetical protein
VRALIDRSVFHAEKYYSTYLSEPSPAGDFSISAGGIATEEHLSLVRVLQEMKDVGAGGELLVVTHSDPKGFLMKLKVGGNVSWLFEVMDKIQKIDEGIRRHDAIAGMKAQEVGGAWRKWFADFDPGIKLTPDFQTNPDWSDYVAKKFDEWFVRQGRVTLGLPDPRADLRDLIDLLKQVRTLGFKRLEFRSCRIGSDKTAMEKIAKFLNVNTVVAPTKVETFYGVIPTKGIFESDARKLEARLKRMAGRVFLPKIPMGLFVSVRSFTVLAKDEDALKAFVQTFIKAKYSGSVSPFVVGGVNSTGSTPTVYTFPLDSSYKSLLVKFDAAAAKSGTP